MLSAKLLDKPGNLPARFAGMLLFVAGFIIFMGIISGEIFYNYDFNSRDHYISELAVSPDQNHAHPQPSASIFDTSMIISGILIMITAYLIQASLRKLLFTLPLGLFGLGYLGVGIFPGDMAPWHGIFAFILFLSGGISAVASFRIVNSPMKFIFIVLGLISLITLIAFKSFVPLLGVGGTERWSLYPLVFFLTGLGGYLAKESKKIPDLHQP
jgi:hypothetical membrane protein